MSANCLCKNEAGKNRNCSAKCFCELWLFENFSEDEYVLLQSIGKQKVITKGEMVFSEGDAADEIFLIKTGRIKLSKYLEDGSEIILDFRKHGEIFGEDAFFDKAVFPMYAVAMEETITCGAGKADLEMLILNNPHIGLAMMKNISAKLSALTNRLENVSIANIEDRIYQILKNIIKEHGIITRNNYQLPFALTHEELSFLANAHRVSVTKAVNKLVKSGKILKKGKIYLLPNS
jgi:CRP-like cAMP-binding protein